MDRADHPGAGNDAAPWRAWVDASPLAKKFHGARIVMVASGRPRAIQFVDEDFARAAGSVSGAAFRGQFADGGNAAARQLRGLAQELPDGVARIFALSGQADVALICANVPGPGAPVLVIARKGQAEAPPVAAPAAPAARPSGRFLWRLDGAGRFRDVSPALDAAFAGGPSAAEPLADFLRRRGVAGGEAWLRAVGERASFANLELTAPPALDGAARTITLSGARWLGSAAEDVAMSGFGHSAQLAEAPAYADQAPGETIQAAPHPPAAQMARALDAEPPVAPEIVPTGHAQAALGAFAGEAQLHVGAQDPNADQVRVPEILEIRDAQAPGDAIEAAPPEIDGPTPEEIADLEALDGAGSAAGETTLDSAANAAEGLRPATAEPGEGPLAGEPAFSTPLLAPPPVDAAAFAAIEPMDSPANENPVPAGEVEAESRLAARLGDNVVPLRPGLAPAGAENGAALTPDERNAFREIARALGARMRPARPAAEGASSATAVGDEPPKGDLEALVDKLPVGVMVFRETETLFANKTLLDLLDQPNLAALRGAGGAQALFNAQSGDATGGLALRRANGDSVAVDARALALNWGGAPATLVALRRALDGEARAAVAAAEAKARRHADGADGAEALLNASADGFARLDAAGRVVWANAAVERLLGRSAVTLPGVAFASLFPRQGQGVDAALARLNQPMLAHGRIELDCAAPGAAGAQLRLTLTRIDAGPEAAVGAIIRDAAPERAKIAEAEDARAEAARASQMKSETLARISHEIRTPLHAILGFVEVMMEQRFGPIGNERYRDYLKDIHGSGQHVVSLANDLLDIAKIESGRLDLNFGPVDANRIIRDCLSLMQPQAAQEHVIVRTSLHDGLPRVLADERALRQIILNLVSNAVKFNAPGGQVIVSTDLGEGGEALIRVRDTGLGMDERELAAAMQPFTQLGPKKAGGAGLGLPLTKALAEANHARFAIQSEKRQGTLVELAFPIAQAAQ